MKTYASLAVLLLLVAGACIEAHTTGFCFKLDRCTGLYEAAYSTYHTVGGDGLPSGGALVDGFRTDFTSAISVNAGFPPGFTGPETTCFMCPPSGTSLAETETWQLTPATISLTPGPHSVTLSSDSYREQPCTGGTGCASGCWPQTITFAGIPAGSMSCSAPVSFNIRGPNAAQPCTVSAAYPQPTCDISECPTFTCSTQYVSGIPINGVIGITPAVGTAGYTANWRMLVNGVVPPNANQCTIVIQAVDNRPPENVVCPPDVSQLCTGPSGAIVGFGQPTSDDCSSVTYTPSQGSNTVFPIGGTTVTYTARDARGQTSTCTFQVQINSNPPTWQVCNTDNLVVNFPPPAGPGQNSQATINYPTPVPLSGCGVPFTANVIGGPAQGDTVDVVDENPTQVTWESDPDPVTGEQIICSWQITFGFVQLLDIIQFDRPSTGNVAMYIPFKIRWEFINLPIESAGATLSVTDGVSTYVAGTMNMAEIEHEFDGISKLVPGPVDFVITLTGNPSFVIANSLNTYTLVTGNENYW